MIRDYAMSQQHNMLAHADEFTPERPRRMKRLRRRLAWQRLLAPWRARLALPAALLLALGVVAGVPLPARAAQLGAGFSERVMSGASATGGVSTPTVTSLTTARVAFAGTLYPAARRTPVTIIAQRVGNAGATSTMGTMLTRAQRVFNTPPVSLAALFSTLGITAQPGATYRIAVQSGATTLSSATVTLAGSL